MVDKNFVREKSKRIKEYLQEKEKYYLRILQKKLPQQWG